MTSSPVTLITFPCYNEEEVLEEHIRRAEQFCRERLLDDDWTILIADNGSVDRTPAIGERLAAELPRVQYQYLRQKGRGHSLRTCWLSHAADYYCYMDADLATELRHLPELLQALKDGADAAIGSRYQPGSRIIGRAWDRALSSRGYRFCLWLLFRVRFSDAQCGFKGIRREVRDRLLPLTRDDHWFFDSELLILTERSGRTIREIPVVWTDNQSRDSKVRLFRDILYFFRCMRDFRHRLAHDRELQRALG